MEDIENSKPMHYSLGFDGFWLEENINDIPNSTGIFCVHTCKYVPKNGTVLLKKLIEVNDSQFVRDYISEDENLNRWKNMLNEDNNEILCFSYCNIREMESERVRKIICSALKQSCDMKSDFQDNHDDYKILDIDLTIFGARGILPAKYPKTESKLDSNNGG